MELWYTDKHTEDVNFSIKVKRQLASHKSEIQQTADRHPRHLRLRAGARPRRRPDDHREGRVHLPRDDDARADGRAPARGKRARGRRRRRRHRARASEISRHQGDRPGGERQGGRHALLHTPAFHGLQAPRPARQDALRGGPPLRARQERRLRPHHRRLSRPLRPGRRPLHPRVLRQLLQRAEGRRSSTSTSRRSTPPTRRA